MVTYTRTARIICRREEDGILLHNEDTGQLFVTNEMGMYILEHFLAEGQLSSDNEIAESLHNTYPAENQNDLRRDIGHFLSSLFHVGWVKETL